LKKTVNNKRANISQIQKYLNGELDAHAMHKLEREAQDDPFLMDALEGYAAKGSQQDNLIALQERIEARTATKTRRIIPWAVISIAASVLGFAVVVGVLYKNNQSPEAIKVAMNQPVKANQADTTEVVKEKAPSAVVMAPGAKRYTAANLLANKSKAPAVVRSLPNSLPVAEAEANNQSMDALKKLPDSSHVEDMIVDYMVKQKQDTVLGGGYVAIDKDKSSSLSVLKSKADGVAATMQARKPSDNNPSALMNAGVPLNLVSGVVLNRIDGSPLPGVSVKVVGKPAATQTDVNGKFTLPNVKKDETLAFGYVGYNSKTLSVKGADSLKVELDENSNSLSEVVVVNAGKTKKANAHPKTGWDNFKKYLKNNAIAPDEKEGTVELNLTVNPNGSITNITISKSLNTAANNKAVSLIKDGPNWAGNTNGKPEVVKVKIDFHK
jgi:TonB family protein